MRTRKKFILAQILIANPSSERNPPSNPASWSDDENEKIFISALCYMQPQQVSSYFAFE
jgi:hypothetical protein